MAGANYFSAHRRLLTVSNVAGGRHFTGMKSPGGDFFPVNIRRGATFPGGALIMEHRRTSNDALTDQCCEFVDNPLPNRQPVQWCRG